MKFVFNNIYILVFALLSFGLGFAKTSSNPIERVGGLIQDPPPPPTPPPGLPIDEYVFVFGLMALIYAIFKINQSIKNKKTSF